MAVAIGIVAILFAVILIILVKRNKRKATCKETDYRALYVLGICFIPVGIATAIATKNPGLMGITALGVVYMIMGLQNKDKWKKA